MIRIMTADGPGRPVRKVPSLSHRSLALLAILAALSWSGLAQDGKKNPKHDPDAIGDRNVGKGVNFYSLEKEIAVGRQLAQEVERQAKVITDPVIAEYVNRVGQNLVRNSDAKVPFTIKVLDSEEVNAFALPGGFFFVNSGLILKADSEAELAGVMGHEIAHVAARHGTRSATKGQHRADRHACHGDRHPLWLDRLRRPARRGISHTHGVSGLFAQPMNGRRTTWACSTCIRPVTIPLRLWTSSKR